VRTDHDDQERMRIVAGAYNLEGGDPRVDGEGSALEPWSEAAARQRLDEIRSALPVEVPPGAPLLDSNSNDTWLLEDSVLRVCWRGDQGRMLREARLLQLLPADIPRPALLAGGGDGRLSWVLVERVEGRTLDQAWPDLTEREATALVAEFAGLLRRLHGWRPAGDVSGLLLDGLPDAAMEPEAIAGRTPIALPIPLARRLAAAARSMPFVDGALIDRVEERLDDLTDLDTMAGPEEERVVLHGDASIVNVMVREGRVAALLDFEWTRLGPRDLELLLPLRTFAAGAVQRPDLAGVGVSALRGAYPELFERPDLERRLWLCEIAFNLRGLHVWPAYAPEDEMEPAHPVRRLRALVEGPSAVLQGGAIAI
jgi:aminoglycoside phosphotransferase (APT) family kinase protein